MKIWKKFHKLFDGLKVSLENTYLPEEMLGLDQHYMENGLIYKNHFTQKVYEPALEILGDSNYSDAVQIVFGPLIYPVPRYRMLQFSHKSAARSNWIIVGRFGEEKVFGFDAENTRDKNYIHLAYPGLADRFIPVYFKIQEQKNSPDFVYLEVWAWNEDKKIIVQSRRVAEYEAPDHLILAKPILAVA